MRAHHITCSEEETDELDVTGLDDEIFDITISSDTEPEVIESDDSDGVDSDSDGHMLHSVFMTGIRRVQTPEDITGSQCAIVYPSCLETLANNAPRKSCTVRECGKAYTIKHSWIGTALYLTWVGINYTVTSHYCQLLYIVHYFI